MNASKFRAIALTLVVMLISNSMLHAKLQRLGVWNGAVFIQIDIPARIILTPDGAVEVVYATWGPFAESTWRDSAWLPTEVPVYTRDRNGQIWIGGRLLNPNETKSEVIRWTEPLAVVEHRDGSLLLDSAPRAFARQSEQPIPPMCISQRSVVTSVPILYGQNAADEYVRAAPRTEPTAFEEFVPIDTPQQPIPAWAEHDVATGQSLVVLGNTLDPDHDRPRKARCFVKDPHGDWIWGGYRENTTGHPAPIRRFNGHWGAAIVQNPDGIFTLQVTSGSVATPLSTSEPLYPSGARRMVLGAQWVRIQYSGPRR